MTGELNRSHLVASLAETFEDAKRFRSTFAFMVVGIDHLTRVNDAFGFDVADEVIRKSPSASARGCAAAMCSGVSPATSSV